MTRGGIAAALTTALLIAPAPGPATAHVGHATPTVNVGGFAFSPPTLTVIQNDFVEWDWTGPDLNHSITADAGQAERFDSDPGEPAAGVGHRRGEAFTYYFAKLGTFTYYCKVHPAMRGRIVVQRPPAPTGPPRIAGLRAAVAAHRKLRITFRVSTSAGMSVRVRRAGGRRVLRSGFRFVRRGRGSMTLPLRGLRGGRYSVTARAMDDAGKNSKTARAAFRLRSG